MLLKFIKNILIKLILNNLLNLFNKFNNQGLFFGGISGQWPPPIRSVPPVINLEILLSNVLEGIVTGIAFFIIVEGCFYIIELASEIEWELNEDNNHISENQKKENYNSLLKLSKSLK